MVGFVVACLKGDKQRLRILPVAAQDGDLSAAKILVQRQTGCFRAGPRGVVPEEVQDGGCGGSALIPGTDRLLESPRQPEQLRREEGMVASIGIVERAAQRPGEVDREQPGLVKRAYLRQPKVRAQRGL